ncbi:uncharacterized protein JCM6883_002516 [Sporobolomyces salmoneus]|uniref:uncharacterized protein n=1 Tax=Sporobolomyces salmoneus TaxID=183962 RepID=UPI00317EEC6E
MPINVAVIGFGMSATVFHLPFLFSLPSHFNVHTIVERSATSTSSKARDAFPHLNLNVVNTLEEALEIEEIEAVWVLSINDTHYDYAKKCLEKGKHVVVEKPVTPTSGEAEELAKLAEEKNLVLAVYQNRRWDADFLTIKKMIDEGTFGELSEFQSNFDRFRNEAAVTKVWKEKDLPGSGLAYDLGSHLVDQLLSLFGPPHSITAHLSNSRLIGNPSVPDSFRILLHYPPSPSTPSRSLPLTAIAQSSSLSLMNPQQRFLVKGTEACYLKHGLDPQEDSLKKGGKEAIESESFGKEREEMWGTLWTKEGERKVESEKGEYRKWFENVAEAIESGDREKLIVKPEQAALTIKLIELAIQSSKEGRTIEL